MSPVQTASRSISLIESVASVLPRLRTVNDVSRKSLWVRSEVVNWLPTSKLPVSIVRRASAVFAALGVVTSYSGELVSVTLLKGLFVATLFVRALLLNVTFVSGAFVNAEFVSVTFDSGAFVSVAFVSGALVSELLVRVAFVIATLAGARFDSGTWTTVL